MQAYVYLMKRLLKSILNLNAFISLAEIEQYVMSGVVFQNGYYTYFNFLSPTFSISTAVFVFVKMRQNDLTEMKYQD